MIENRDDWKDQSKNHNDNRCMDAMSLINTFCVIVTRLNEGALEQDRFYDEILSLYRDCDNYGFVNNKKKTQA